MVTKSLPYTKRDEELAMEAFRPLLDPEWQSSPGQPSDEPISVQALFLRVLTSIALARREGKDETDRGTLQ